MIHKILNNKKYNPFIFIFLFIAFSIVSLAAKNIFVNYFNNKDFFLVTIDYIKNYGAAFSLLNTHTNLLIIISLVILLALTVYIIKNINKFSKSDVFFTAMLYSGITCNLAERIAYGYVTDYIKINFISFPIFNVPDLFISAGAFILICNILFNNEQ